MAGVKSRVAVVAVALARAESESGPAEADPKQGKISHESPLGKALIGKRVGEKVNIQAPAGGISFEVLEIE